MRRAGAARAGAPVADLLAKAEAAGPLPDGLFFLPYLASERVPPDEPSAAGAFLGLTEATSRGDLARAVLEGVAFGLAALHPDGQPTTPIAIVGGSARSKLWSGMIADALNRPLAVFAESHASAAFGAARLARLAVDGGDEAAICAAPEVMGVVEPGPDSHAAQRLARYRDVTAALRDAPPVSSGRLEMLDQTSAL